MPFRAKKVCQRPGCGQLCDGRVCAAHAGEDPQRVARRRFDKVRGSASARGYGRRHERLRKLILARDPLCKIGHFCNGLAPSTVMDHILPKSEGGDESESNLQGVCASCHDFKTATEDTARGRGGKFLKSHAAADRRAAFSHTTAK